MNSSSDRHAFDRATSPLVFLSRPTDHASQTRKRRWHLPERWQALQYRSIRDGSKRKRLSALQVGCGRPLQSYGCGRAAVGQNRRALTETPLLQGARSGGRAPGRWDSSERLTSGSRTLRAITRVGASTAILSTIPRSPAWRSRHGALRIRLLTRRQTQARTGFALVLQSVTVASALPIARIDPHAVWTRLVPDCLQAPRTRGRVIGCGGGPDAPRSKKDEDPHLQFWSRCVRSDARRA